MPGVLGGRFGPFGGLSARLHRHASTPCITSIDAAFRRFAASVSGRGAPPKARPNGAFLWVTMWVIDGRFGLVRPITHIDPATSALARGRAIRLAGCDHLRRSVKMRNCAWPDSQGVALGWYALPRWVRNGSRASPPNPSQPVLNLHCFDAHPAAAGSVTPRAASALQKSALHPATTTRRRR